MYIYVNAFTILGDSSFHLFLKIIYMTYQSRRISWLLMYAVTRDELFLGPYLYVAPCLEYVIFFHSHKGRICIRLWIAITVS
jgi:hypothetical protein